MPQLQIKNLPGIDPNDRPDPDPATAVSPEGLRVLSLNRVQLDRGNIIKEASEVVVYQLFL